MNLEISQELSNEQTEARLPWHKPELQKLTVSIDTAAAPGSGGDFEAGTLFISDRRVKQDVAGITDALAGILSLNGVTYRYNTDKAAALNLSTAPQIGFIAQDLEQVYPALVKTREDGMKAVNYAHLVPVLVEAIKEQQAMIADLQQQINGLSQ